MGYLGKGPGIETVLLIRHKLGGLSYVRTLLMSNPLHIYCALYLAGARPYYERALAICEQVLGPEHPDTATSLNNLGLLFHAQGDLVRAGPYCKTAGGRRYT